MTHKIGPNPPPAIAAYIRDFDAKRSAVNYKPPRSWYCQPCGVEVYSICCRHCGKTEGEAA